MPVSVPSQADFDALVARVSALENPIVPPPPIERKVLHELSFTNTIASPSSGFVKFGLAFEKLDVPTGEVPVVKINGGKLRGYPIDIARWSDGSIRKCTMVADLGLVSSAITVQVYSEQGVVPPSSFDQVSYIAGLASDATVEVTGRVGSATGPMSNLTYSLKSASAVSTKRVKQEDTSLFVRYFCWQKLTGEEHLVCLNYLDIWLDVDGSTVIALEWVPVLSQHWWVADPQGVVQVKQKYTYNAVVKSGATVLDARTSLGHAYYCRWASLAPDATPHWIGSLPKPTLSIAHSTASRKKMARVGGYVPPLDWDESGWGASAGASEYVPLGVNGHRAQINNGGGYPGRGQITQPDATAIATQSAGDWRKARIAAQAGLSVYNAVYDHRVIDIQPEPSLIPLKFAKLGTQAYSGLGVEVWRARGTSFNSGKNELPLSVPSGGTGAFAGYDNDHAVPYSAFMAFITGERYLQDAQLCMADMACTYSNLNVYGHDKSFEWTQSLTGNALGIPLTPFHGSIPATGGVRGRAWGGNNCFWAWALTSDVNPHQAYLKKLMQNYDDFFTVSYSYMSADHKEYGGWLWNEPQYNDVWMHNWVAMIYSQWRSLAIDSGFGDGFQKITNMSIKLMLNALATNRLGTVGQYNLAMPCGGKKPSAATGWINGERALFCAHPATWNGSTFTLTQPDPSYPIANGDRLILTSSNSSDGTSGLTWAAELKWSTVYHLVSVAGNTFQLTSSPGGPAITLTGSGSTMIALDKTSYNVEISPTNVGGDSQFMFGLAAIVSAYLDGSHGISLSDVARYKQFMSTSARSGYAPWNYSEAQAS